MAVTTERAAGDTTIRPFTIEIPQADLDDLRARIAATRWPEKETVDDQSQGAQLATMQALARYWLTEYDWRKCEARLNAVPNFITEIDGLDIHFIHVRSKHEDALPLDRLPRLAGLDRRAAEDHRPAHRSHRPRRERVGRVPCGDPVDAGLRVLGQAGQHRLGSRCASRNAYVELMRRLGYTRFVAQGGDWGAVVVDVMAGGRDAPAAAQPAPPELIGIHTNMAGVVPPDIDAAAAIGSPAPAGLSDEELRATSSWPPSTRTSATPSSWATGRRR